MKKRLTFKCRNRACSREYSITFQVEENQPTTLLAPCPFCETESVADIGPYRSKVDRVQKSDSSDT